MLQVGARRRRGRERLSQSGVDGCALTFDRCQFYTPVDPNERGARVFLPLIRGEPSPPLPYPTLARSQPIICFVIDSRIQRSNMEGPGCISLPVGVDPQIKDSSDDQSAAESSHYISCLGQKSALRNVVVLRVESINPTEPHQSLPITSHCRESAPR